MHANEDNWDAFALLLVDVQQDFWTGETAVSHPHFPANITQLLAWSRQQKIDIIHLRASFQPDRSDWMVRYKLGRPIPCIEGTPGVENLPCAQPLPGETVLAKQTFDGFHNPALLAHLQQQGKQFVLVAGLITSVCVFLTAASAAQHGFLVAVVEDCCADRSTMHHHVLDSYPFIFERVTLAALAAQHGRWQMALAGLREGA